jgi:hypothetical protein
LAQIRRILVQAGDEVTGPLGCRWLKGLAVAMLGVLACWLAVAMLGVLACWACWACWHGSGPRGRRPDCRDHGRAGDHGGSRGRARVRSAVIKDQFMIMEPHAGDRLAAAGAGRGFSK